MNSLHDNKENFSEIDPVAISLYGFMSTKLLISFHNLGVFSLISKEKKISVLNVSEKLDLNAHALGRAFEVALAWGLLKKEKNLYSLPERVERFTVSGSTDYLGPILEHFDNSTIPLFEYLECALKDGNPQWLRMKENQGRDGHAFKALFEDDRYAKSFHQAMWNLGFSASCELVAKGVVDDVEYMIDLGGGSGAFSIAACNQKKLLKACVFDLPQVESYCDENIVKHGLEDRLSFISGDFWKDELPQAHCYALGYVLSNWSDEDCIKLLKKIYNHLDDGGKIIILERILEEDRSGPFLGLMQDMAMLIETGGMHRPFSHYQYLLNQSGFGGCCLTISPNFEKHAISAVKETIN